MSYTDIGFIVLTEIVGDFGYKMFAKNGGITNFLIGTGGYVGVIYFLIKTLQYSNILMVNAVWDGVSALLESLAAYYVLGERFHDPWKYFGIVLIVAGLFFLKMPMVSPHKFVFPKFFSEEKK